MFEVVSGEASPSFTGDVGELGSSLSRVRFFGRRSEPRLGMEAVAGYGRVATSQRGPQNSSSTAGALSATSRSAMDRAFGGKTRAGAWNLRGLSGSLLGKQTRKVVIATANWASNAAGRFLYFAAQSQRARGVELDGARDEDCLPSRSLLRLACGFYARSRSFDHLEQLFLCPYRSASSARARTASDPGCKYDERRASAQRSLNG